MPKYTVMARELWSYSVEADTEEEAQKRVDQDPTGYRQELFEVKVVDIEVDNNETV